MLHFLRTLDRRRFLGFPIWEFSFRSLPRRYGRMFLRDIVLRHPVRSVQGMLAYRRIYREGRQAGAASLPFAVDGDASLPFAVDGGASLPSVLEGDVTHLHAGTEADLQAEIVDADGGFVVALGFCQKPVGGPGAGCPAGRFNHDCHVLVRSDLLGIRAARLPIPCRGCDVRLIGTAALQAGAAVYIMTSAADIARHIFIPTLESDRFRYGLFLQCPYSIPAMALPLLICRIRSLLVGYGEGDCSDYAQFSLADEGTKDERTCLNPPAHARVLGFLEDVASARRARGSRYTCFHREGFVYVPVISLT